VTRIVVDPPELRRAATRIRDAAGDFGVLRSRIRGHAIPELPPALAGSVPAELESLAGRVDTYADRLPEAAKELDVRAFWGEIAGALRGESCLTSAQLAQLLAYARDGSLIDYATAEQRVLAGGFIGDHYRDRFREPDQLIELADILRANGGDADFSTAFVDRFGADNLADVPRVIQAMDWSGTMMAGPGSDSLFDYELAQELGMDGYELDRDPVELLGGFSLALATATASGQLSRTVERDLAFDEDRWAVAQLLHGDHRFGATFLRDMFHAGVIEELGRESGILFGGPGTSYAPIGGGDGEGPMISTDQKRLILDALGRNGEAAMLALSDRVPEDSQIGLLQGMDDPIRILNDHLRIDDSSEILANLYSDGVDWAHASGETERAAQLTLSAIDTTLNGDVDRDELTVALAADLGEHRMRDLHVSAASLTFDDVDDGQVGWVRSDDGDSIRLSVGQLSDLVRELGDVEDANRAFLDGATRYEAGLIAEGTAPGNDGSLEWARELGSFKGVLMVANDLENGEDFDASNDRHRMLFSALNNTVGVLAKAPLVSVVAGTGMDGLSMLTEPDAGELVETNGGGESAIFNSTHAAIVTGYHENGAFGAYAGPDGMVVNGELVAYSDLRGVDLDRFNEWMRTDPDVDSVAGDAFDRADQARDNVVELLLR
jgi:hypothetical protein